MVRHIFDETQEFIDWISENVTKEKYKAYQTKEKEIILVPKKSTRPLEYAYMKFSEQKDLESVIKKLTSKGLRVWSLKAEEWDDQKPVGIRPSPEEIE